MKLTIRNTKVRDDRGQMVSATFLGNGSIADEVDSWLTNNPDAIADAASQDVSDWLEDNITQPTNPVIDASLSVSGAAADAKKTGDELSDLKSAIENIEEEIEGDTGSGLTDDIKQALLQLAQKVVYKDDGGQTYYDDLYDALYPPIVVTNITLNTNSLSFATLNSTQQLTATTTPTGGAVTWTSSDTSVATVSSTGLVTSVGYGNATITATSGSVSATCSVAVAQATVTSISAVYTQSGTVYDTDSLDDLKSDLVVTATWSDSSTSTVASTDYTLNGTLTAGTSTITVSYGGKTTTFTVTVTSEYPTNYTWLYKASDGQTLTQRSDLVTKTITNGTISEELVNGLLHITAPQGNNGCKWDFVQATQESAVLTIKFKIMDCPTANSVSGFQPQVSNGTGGAKFGTARQGSYTGAIHAQTVVGTTVQWEGELTTDTWHILELDLDNSKQTVTLDGTAIASNETTANQYCVNNRIFVQSNTANPGNPTEVYIDWISYWNRSA